MKKVLAIAYPTGGTPEQVAEFWLRIESIAQTRGNCYRRRRRLWVLTEQSVSDNSR